MPEPMRTPVLSRLASCTGTQPASAIAKSAATKPYWIKVSILRFSLLDIRSSSLKLPSRYLPLGTSPAIREDNWVASKDFIGPRPDFPSINLFHVKPAPQASGVTRPIPVTTTRLILIRGTLLIRI